MITANYTETDKFRLLIIHKYQWPRYLDIFIHAQFMIFIAVMPRFCEVKRKNKIKWQDGIITKTKYSIMPFWSYKTKICKENFWWQYQIITRPRVTKPRYPEMRKREVITHCNALLKNNALEYIKTRC